MSIFEYLFHPAIVQPDSPTATAEITAYEDFDPLVEPKIEMLEERLRQVEAFEVANVEMAQRIAKAQEILKDIHDSNEDIVKIEKALDALEGK